MATYHVPEKGEKVWNEARHKQGRQPNGFIYAVIYAGRECIIMYHESDPPDDFDIMSWSELNVYWEPAMFGGTYMIWEGI